MSPLQKKLKKQVIEGQQDIPYLNVKRQIGSGQYAGEQETRLDRFCRSLWPYLVLGFFLRVAFELVIVSVDGMYLRQGQISNPADDVRRFVESYTPVFVLLWLSSPWWIRALVMKTRAVSKANRQDRAYAALQSKPQPLTTAPAASLPVVQPQPSAPPISPPQSAGVQLPSIFSDD